MRRYGHHRAFAIAHQHVVAYPDGHGFVSQRVAHEQAGGDPFLFHRFHVRLGHAALPTFFNEGGQLRVAFCGAQSQRVFGGDGDKGRAHDGVGAGGEHPQLTGFAIEFIREGKAHAFAFANPVFLHRAHLLRPAGQVVQRREQFFGVGGNLHVIHGDFALFDQRARAPAAPFNHLLVGQHGFIDRVPVDHALFLVNQPFFQQAGKQPLFVAVVVGIAGSDFARPVQRKAQPLQLAFHVGDVFARPFRRRDVVLDGGVFGGHPEGVPAHWLQHVVAAHPARAGEHVANRVIAHMPHVQLARRVGQHGKTVELRARAVFAHFKTAGLLPVLLGAGFEGGGVVFVFGVAGGGHDGYAPGGGVKNLQLSRIRRRCGGRARARRTAGRVRVRRQLNHRAARRR